MPLSWLEIMKLCRQAARVACCSIVRGTFAACALAYCLGATAAAPASPAPLAVTAGGAHAVIQKTDGSIALWGDNSAGQLGTGVRLMTVAPLQVAGVPAASAVSAGVGHALVLA